jgi:16S rRNA C967 or C1407 C5-methylase (RsmB/RsmF family)
VTREENDSVVEVFLRSHKDFQVEDLRLIVPQSLRPLIDEEGFLRTYPGLMTARDHYRLDGFFAARMRRTSTKSWEGRNL